MRAMERCGLAVFPIEIAISIRPVSTPGIALSYQYDGLRAAFFRVGTTSGNCACASSSSRM